MEGICQNLRRHQTGQQNKNQPLKPCGRSQFASGAFESGFPLFVTPPHGRKQGEDEIQRDHAPQNTERELDFFKRQHKFLPNRPFIITRISSPCHLTCFVHQLPKTH
jgi:hypothetical protein